MATKSNIRSIRFSDELAELIDRQVGNSFTEKFENLITRCVWELPRKEEEIKRVDELIREKREEWNKLRLRAQKVENTLRSLTDRMNLLESTMFRSEMDWKEP